MREPGKVLAVNGSYAIVERERAATCNACALKAGCGSAVLGSILGRRQRSALALNPVSAVVGDRVELAAEPHGLIRSAAAVYMVPLVFMCGAAGGTQYFAQGPEPLTAAAGFLGLAVGCTLLRYRFGRRHAETEGRLVVQRRFANGAFESPGLTK